MPFHTQSLKDRTVALFANLPANELGRNWLFYPADRTRPCCALGHMAVEQGTDVITWYDVRNVYGSTDEEMLRIAVASDSGVAVRLDELIPSQLPLIATTTDAQRLAAVRKVIDSIPVANSQEVL